mmetsp:Transcript_7671/g.20989  ORF Transcript_7671/g.20989 Transcript_7671/m.20989 type:complete len:215 (+) Transcript_7671:616-1260(+)
MCLLGAVVAEEPSTGSAVMSPPHPVELTRAPHAVIRVGVVHPPPRQRLGRVHVQVQPSLERSTSGWCHASNGAIRCASWQRPRGRGRGRAPPIEREVGRGRGGARVVQVGRCDGVHRWPRGRCDGDVALEAPPPTHCTAHLHCVAGSHTPRRGGKNARERVDGGAQPLRGALENVCGARRAYELRHDRLHHVLRRALAVVHGEARPVRRPQLRT